MRETIESKNKPTIKHLKIACRHIDELMDAGVSENHAIRTLELLADVYGQTHLGGVPAVHHINRVPVNQWSLAARRARKKKPRAKPGTFLRVEHGTPRRTLARKIRELYKRRKLTAPEMAKLINKYWKLAVLTHEEDRRLRRTKDFVSPQRRWAEAKISFPKNSPNART
jgi:hypothetical protein